LILMSNGMKQLGLLIGMASFYACAQAEPLSITMVNPKTNTVMRCAARQGPATNNASLSPTVELCAKQLEARGFIRVDENTAAQLMNK
jgi:hypothetical protein